ncbi:aminotransferase class V-fold PLP-dependent enzyme, partial [candidate division KSB1 bacterium]|nr:aminotransferase class V-fold PLP-dependent enzyme [candidate division KSB1 bacterium]
MRRYIEFQRLGNKNGRLEYVREVQAQIRTLFADLIGAETSEIGLVHCTKAGEQIVLDALPGIEQGENIVTNDLHFSGSLHNLIGLQKAGRDVRIVRARDWQVSLEDMQAAIDDRTALVTVSLVSNINGHIEDLSALSEVAYAHGALVFADIIQAVGIVPMNVQQLGIDV